MTRAELIFDFDGVITDTNELKGEILSSLLKEHLNQDSLEVMNYHLHNPQLRIKDKIRHFGPNLSIEAIEKIELELRARVLNQSNDVLLPGAAEVLPQLASRYFLSIASAAPGREIKEILSRHSLLSHFRAIAGNLEVKSDYLVQRNERLQSEGIRLAWYVGDALSDEKAAEMAGVPFIGFRLQSNRSRQTVDSWKDLYDVLN